MRGRARRSVACRGSPVGSGRASPCSTDRGIRSRRVRKLLKLGARTARLLARYQRTLDCAVPVVERANALRREVKALELTLTGTDLGELRRTRSAAAGVTRRP